MIINQLKMRQNQGCTSRTQAVHNLYTENAGTQKAAKVNVSADLSRSQSLQYFTTLASNGACGDKEQ
jgi:hypothetical protein